MIYIIYVKAQKLLELQNIYILYKQIYIFYTNKYKIFLFIFIKIFCNWSKINKNKSFQKFFIRNWLFKNWFLYNTDKKIFYKISFCIFTLFLFSFKLNKNKQEKTSDGFIYKFIYL